MRRLRQKLLLFRLRPAAADGHGAPYTLRACACGRQVEWRLRAGGVGPLLGVLVITTTGPPLVRPPACPPGSLHAGALLCSPAAGSRCTQRWLPCLPCRMGTRTSSQRLPAPTTPLAPCSTAPALLAAAPMARLLLPLLLLQPGAAAAAVAAVGWSCTHGPLPTRPCCRAAAWWCIRGAQAPRRQGCCARRPRSRAPSTSTSSSG